MLGHLPDRDRHRRHSPRPTSIASGVAPPAYCARPCPRQGLWRFRSTPPTESAIPRAAGHHRRPRDDDRLRPRDGLGRAADPRTGHLQRVRPFSASGTGACGTPCQLSQSDPCQIRTISHRPKATAAGQRPRTPLRLAGDLSIQRTTLSILRPRTFPKTRMSYRTGTPPARKQRRCAGARSTRRRTASSPERPVRGPRAGSRRGRPTP